MKLDLQNCISLQEQIMQEAISWVAFPLLSNLRQEVLCQGWLRSVWLLVPQRMATGPVAPFPSPAGDWESGNAIGADPMFGSDLFPVLPDVMAEEVPLWNMKYDRVMIQSKFSTGDGFRFISALTRNLFLVQIVVIHFQQEGECYVGLRILETCLPDSKHTND